MDRPAPPGPPLQSAWLTPLVALAGVRSTPLREKHRVLTTGLPGKSPFGLLLSWLTVTASLSSI